MRKQGGASNIVTSKDPTTIQNKASEYIKSILAQSKVYIEIQYELKTLSDRIRRKEVKVEHRTASQEEAYVEKTLVPNTLEQLNKLLTKVENISELEKAEEKILETENPERFTKYKKAVEYKNFNQSKKNIYNAWIIDLQGYLLTLQPHDYQKHHTTDEVQTNFDGIRAKITEFCKGIEAVHKTKLADYQKGSQDEYEASFSPVKQKAQDGKMLAVGLDEAEVINISEQEELEYLREDLFVTEELVYELELDIKGKDAKIEELAAKLVESSGQKDEVASLKEQLARQEVELKESDEKITNLHQQLEEKEKEVLVGVENAAAIANSDDFIIKEKAQLQLKVQTLQREITSLRDNLKTKEAELTRVKELFNTQFEQAINKAREAGKVEAKEEIANLTQQLKDKTAQLEAVQAQIRSQISINKGQQAELTNLQQELHEAHEAKNEEIDELKNQMVRLKQQLDTLDIDHAEKVGELEAETFKQTNLIGVLRAEADKAHRLQNELEAVKAELAKIQQERSNLATASNTTRKVSSELQQENAELTKTLEGVQADLSRQRELANGLTQARKENSAMSQEISNLQQEIEKLRQEQVPPERLLNTNSAERETEIARLNALLRATTDEKQRAEESLLKVQQKFTELQTELSDAQSRLATSYTEKEAALTAKEAAEAELATIEQQILKREQDFGNLQETIKNTLAAQQDLALQASESRKQLDEALERNVQLESDLTGYKAAQEALQQQLQDAKTQLRQTETTISEQTEANKSLEILKNEQSILVKSLNEENTELRAAIRSLESEKQDQDNLIAKLQDLIKAQQQQIQQLQEDIAQEKKACELIDAELKKISLEQKALEEHNFTLLQQLSESVTENNRLQGVIDKKVEEFNELQETHKQGVEKLIKKDDELQRLTAALKENERAKKQLEKQIKGFQEGLDKAGKSARESTETLVELRQELQKKEDENLYLNDILLKKDHEYTLLKKEVFELQDELEKVKNETAKQIRQAKEKAARDVEDADARVKEIEGELRIKTELLEENQKKLAEEKSISAKNNADLIKHNKALTARVAELESELEAANRRAAEAERRLKELVVKYAELKEGHKETLRMMSEQHEQEKLALTRTKDAEIQNLQNQIATLESALQQAQSEKQQVEESNVTRIHNINLELLRLHLELELELSEERNKTKQTQIDNLVQEKAGLQGQLAEVEFNVSEIQSIYEAALADLRNHLAVVRFRWETQVAAAAHEITEKSDQIIALQTELARVSAAYDNLVTVTTEEKSALKSQVNSLTEQLRVAAEEKESLVRNHAVALDQLGATNAALVRQHQDQQNILLGRIRAVNVELLAKESEHNRHILAMQQASDDIAKQKREVEFQLAISGSDKAALEARNKDLAEQEETLRNEMGRMRDAHQGEIDRMRAGHTADLGRLSAAHEDELARMRAAQTYLQNELRTTRAELAAKEMEHHRLLNEKQRELDDITREKNRIEHELAASRLDKAELEARNKLLAEQEETLRNEMGRMRVAYQGEIDRLRTEKGDLQNRLRNAEDRIANLELENTALTAANNDQRAEIDRLTTELGNKEDNIADLNVQIADLSRELGAAQADLLRTGNDNHILNNTITRLQNELRSREGELTDERAEVARLNNDIDTLHREINGLRVTNANQANDLALAARQHNADELRNNHLQDRLAVVTRELAALRAKPAAHDIIPWQKALYDSRANENKLNKQITDLTAQLAAKPKEVAVPSAASGSADLTELTRLQAELARAHTKTTDLENLQAKQEQQVKQKEAELQKEITALKAKLAETEKAKEGAEFVAPTLRTNQPYNMPTNYGYPYLGAPNPVMATPYASRFNQQANFATPAAAASQNSFAERVKSEQNITVAGKSDPAQRPLNTQNKVVAGSDNLTYKNVESKGKIDGGTVALGTTAIGSAATATAVGTGALTIGTLASLPMFLAFATLGMVSGGAAISKYNGGNTKYRDLINAERNDNNAAARLTVH